ncbi:helix-turn-helix transcriptional regulator [Modestobacter sp. Leaf380]|uniref:helix-turn-helix transcriptional regulator n=1 Tax=Modestobacter sp. Leaf380 TaxID=1736356 RepID=UPI0006FC3D8C|nr:helix-turn-helix transcriptional regulator [Modestobacter sp. Leaf380]KQS66256.1 hypothetical protein ASG41_13105 [Modestobacter sp. Leaf380]
MNGTESDQPSATVEDVLARANAQIERAQAEQLRDQGYESMDELLAAAETQAREQALGQPSWADLEESLTSLAAEDHIARRLESLRTRAGLSQEALAARLRALGVQMPQSSISKIEGPVRLGRGKRRDITVDEAIALSKALGVSLTELLLPDDALDDLHLHRIMASAGKLWQARQVAQLDYEYAVGKLVQAAQERPEWRSRFAEDLDLLWRIEKGTDDEGTPLTDLPLPSMETTCVREVLADVTSRLEAKASEGEA